MATLGNTTATDLKVLNTIQANTIQANTIQVGDGTIDADVVAGKGRGILDIHGSEGHMYIDGNEVLTSSTMLYLGAYNATTSVGISDVGDIILFNTDSKIYPKGTTNNCSIGTNTNKFKTIYSKTFDGDLSGDIIGKLDENTSSYSTTIDCKLAVSGTSTFNDTVIIADVDSTSGVASAKLQIGDDAYFCDKDTKDTIYLYGGKAEDNGTTKATLVANLNGNATTATNATYAQYASTDTAKGTIEERLTSLGFKSGVINFAGVDYGSTAYTNTDQNGLYKIGKWCFCKISSTRRLTRSELINYLSDGKTVFTVPREFYPKNTASGVLCIGSVDGCVYGKVNIDTIGKGEIDRNSSFWTDTGNGTDGFFLSFAYEVKTSSSGQTYSLEVKRDSSSIYSATTKAWINGTETVLPITGATLMDSIKLVTTVDGNHGFTRYYVSNSTGENITTATYEFTIQEFLNHWHLDAEQKELSLLYHTAR